MRIASWHKTIAYAANCEQRGAICCNVIVNYYLNQKMEWLFVSLIRKALILREYLL